MIRSKLAIFDTLDEALEANLSKNQVFLVLGDEAVDDGGADFYYTTESGGISTLGPWTLEKLGNRFDGISGIVPVNKPSDLDGTLDSTKLYLIDGIVDMTGSGISIEVPASGLSFSGHSFDISKLICSDDNYTLFNSAIGGSGDLLGQDYAVEITGTNSKVYDLVDATGNNAFEFSRINYNNCSSLGEIDGYRQGLEFGTGRFGGTPELTLSNTWAGGYVIDTSIVRGLTDGAYTLYKAGAGFTMNSRFKSNQNIDLPATASFFDFSAANFPNPSTLEIQGAIISRNGLVNATDLTITPNITETELSSAWVNNVGLANTHVGGCVNVTSELLTTITGIGDFVDLNGVYTSGDLQHFDNPALNQLRHLGNDPRDYNITLDLVVDGSPNREVEIKVVKWDDSASSFVDVGTQRRTVNSLAGGRDVAFFTDFITGNLDINDYFKLQIANNTDTTNLTVEIDGFMRVSAR